MVVIEDSIPVYYPPRATALPHGRRTHLIAMMLNSIFENWKDISNVSRQQVDPPKIMYPDMEEVWKFNRAETSLLGMSVTLNGFLKMTSRNIDGGHLVIKTFALTIDAYFTCAANAVRYTGFEPTEVCLANYRGLVTMNEIILENILGDEELAILMLL